MSIVSDGDAVAFHRHQPEADPEFRRVELQIKLEEARDRSIETQLRLAELQSCDSGDLAKITSTTLHHICVCVCVFRDLTPPCLS